MINIIATSAPVKEKNPDGNPHPAEIKEVPKNLNNHQIQSAQIHPLAINE